MEDQRGRSPTPPQQEKQLLQHQQPRDSHDLSLLPRDATRDSLVANMLMSLDQFSIDQAPEHDFTYQDINSPHLFAGETWGNPTPTTTGYHQHQSSYDSDLDTIGPSDDQLETPPPSRGHWSNKSRGAASAGVSNTAPQQPSTPRAKGKTKTHSRSATKNSTLSSGSGSTSIDNGKGPVPRWATTAAAASAGGLANHNNNLARSSPYSMAPPNAQFEDDEDEYAAAPTPNVPGGPRASPAAATRHHSNATAQSDAPSTPSRLQRRASTTRSVKSSSGRSRRAPSTSMPPEVPPLPGADDFDSAPAPSVGYNKVKEDPPKEKPGFFRRVFGGSSKSSSSTNSAMNLAAEPPAIPKTSSSQARNDRPSSNRQQQQQQQQQTMMPPPSTAVSAPPSRDATSSHSNYPTLQKKSSSFFRRRKKSFVDDTPPLPDHVPPVPPITPLTLERARQAAEPSMPVSPVSSLRQVMNPYLRNSGGMNLGGIPKSATAPLADITNRAFDKDNTNDDDDDDDDDGDVANRREEFQRDFSPDYEPSPNAKIRKVSNDDRVHAASKQTKKDASLEIPHRITPLDGANSSFLNLDIGSDGEDADLQVSVNQNHKPRVRASSAGTTGGDRDLHDRTLRGNNKTTMMTTSHSHTGQTYNPNERTKPSITVSTEENPPRSSGSRSTDTGYRTAPSAPPSARIEVTDEPNSKVLGTLEYMQAKGLDEPMFVIGEPTEDDRQKAQKIYDGSEDFIQKDKAASWMGEEGPVRKRTLQAYMELYDFKDQSILMALRSICARLVLRAETQQVDRILVAFSKRWCDSNPNHGFKATDVIHTICYSIMLLNTDLHLADIEQKMTRSQFVKNTLSTIRQAVHESKPDAFQRPSILPEKQTLRTETSRSSLEQDRPSFRHSFRPPPRSTTEANGHDDGTDHGGPLVRYIFTGSAKAWEEQIESVLKTIYSSIRDDRLPLFGAGTTNNTNNIGAGPSQSNLSVGGIMKRTPSVLSKTPSESGLSSRGRIADNGKGSSSRWTSKSRSRAGVGRNGMNSSRTSFDDDNSIWSPAMSSATWSRYSLGRTQASASQDSFASAIPRGDYQQSIGFANALSQAIFRDVDANDKESAPSIMSADLGQTQLLDDESLELAGPPWVKEGMIIHKHHLDGVGKRAKDRNWTEVFAVVQKGQMSLFSFSASKSIRQKSRPRTAGKAGPVLVGGGNWQDNAVNLGTFNLRLTLASALPSPGYSRTRPYVWALSLPSGAVHLFQAGTPEIIKEFVNTANYWSSRLSTHPLIGGVSNIEYGWSEAIVNNALVTAINENSGYAGGKTSRPSSSAAHHRKSSAASGSFRSSSFDHVAGAFTNNSGRGKLPGDKVNITIWTPPTQSSRPSHLSEADQLKSLSNYVKNIEAELQTHNQLRSPMLLAYTPRGQNASKAMANWERKSSYLLREIVKFRTYTDCLQQAETRKHEIYKERDLAQRAARGELSDDEMEVSGDDEADETLRPE